MNIFEENNYKVILKHLLKLKSQHLKGVSSKLALHLNVHASLISVILSGPKDFTEEQMYEICEFLGISKFESEYLLMLLKVERAGSFKLKSHYSEQRDLIKKQSNELSYRIKRDQSLSEADQSIFYSSWIYASIQLYTTLEKDISFEYIREKFNIDHQKLREIFIFFDSYRTGDRKRWDLQAWKNRYTP